MKKALLILTLSLIGISNFAFARTYTVTETETHTPYNKYESICGTINREWLRLGDLHIKDDRYENNNVVIITNIRGESNQDTSILNDYIDQNVCLDGNWEYGQYGIKIYYSVTGIREYAPNH